MRDISQHLVAYLALWIPLQDSHDHPMVPIKALLEAYTESEIYFHKIILVISDQVEYDNILNQ